MGKPITVSPIYVRGKDGKLYEIDRKSTDGNKSDFEKYSIFKLNEDFSKASSELEVTQLKDVTKEYKNPLNKDMLNQNSKSIEAKTSDGFSETFEDPVLYKKMFGELNSFTNNSKVDQPSKDQVNNKQNLLRIVEGPKGWEYMKKGKETE